MLRRLRAGALALVGCLVVAGMSVARPETASAQSPLPCALPHGNSEVTRSGPYEIAEPEVVELESEADGSVIQIGFVRPDASPGYRSPVILHASPYFTTDLRDVDVRDCNPFLVQNFVPHGYTIAFVPTRGAGGTDSCADLMGPLERADLDQAVTWLGTQKWSNGNVGMTGVSYDGSTPWEVAAMGNRHLKTIVPGSGIHDIYKFVYDRGHNDWRWWFFVSGYYHYYGLVQSNPVGGRDPDRWASSVLCDSTEEGLAATFQSYLTGQHDQFGYWKDRNTDPDILKRYRGSVLLVQGLQDWNVSPDHQWPFINELAKRGVYVEQMLGQWDHAYPDSAHGAGPRADYADILLEWWNRWLKGDRRADLGARVEVQDSDMQWRSETAWPPADTTREKLYLTADNTLSEMPDQGEATALLGPGTRNRYFYVITDNMFIYNDAPIDHYCVDCAMLSTTIEADELRLVGIPELELKVTPSGPGGFVAAYLIRVDGDGVWNLLGWGANDLRFPDAEGDPQPVQPGQEISLKVPLQPLDAVIHKGEQLVLILDQGHADHIPTLPFFPVELRYGGDLGTLEFDTTTPAARDFFVPPVIEE
ncbi:MAG TPA: CocE/NonD family hydrolase [Actinomycetota bacterium]|nr:CocE/NonD family hydrolase [Actinomycetota bacterium]